MKYILILLLFVGCSQIDGRGITDTIVSDIFMTRKDACTNLEARFRIVCLKAGYKGYKELEAYSGRAKNRYGYTNSYKCFGTAQCLDKEDK